MSLMIVDNIKKDYTSRNKNIVCHALSGVSFEVNEGEFLSIMGPSGAGKTTLLNIMATIDKLTYGKIFLNEQEITCLVEPELSLFRKENLGFIFQDSNLLDNLTIKENIILPLILLKNSSGIIEDKLKKISNELNILEILEKYPYEVSGGQKQKASAARALIKNPSLILADEPAGSLDSKSTEDLLECLKKLQKVYKTTIILVTHDAFAASYCKRVIFIKDGQFFSEIMSNGDRKDNFKKIISMLSVLEGGSTNEIF